MDIKYPVKCPLLNSKSIDEGACFDIHMVVEGHTPKWTAPEEIYDHDDFQEICKKCQYHRDD